MVRLVSHTMLTNKYNQMILITKEVEQAVRESGIKNGVVNVVSKHTTTGVLVNESLECLESDINEFLQRLVPEDHPYAHARMLKDYGSTAGNPTGHLKSLLTGNHCHMLIADGEIVKGGAQEIYFCEFDGPAKRTILIQVMGE
ncbi:secondary thiamine-phosphate synthase enzyme YjbQ [Muricomes intestini]|uniref:Secondary thiamine-phosphate synthase enzyme n=1 Tax=Muricomes intestini TaxID=1796634 RepID=A0A4R3K9W9_9FIRM|nr:secondary thiamine-phosphate synthase enzyme YjbQ [Muricomes intestini]TCS79441.1 secondary thiamine-phosphate synthase enzyme [Muricomes intestini]